jgi:hypothetical protein
MSWSCLAKFTVVYAIVRVQDHRKPKMDQLATRGHLFDLFAQPFRLLHVDTTATKEQIDDAFARAQQSRTAPFPILVSARDALLDPAGRLSSELAYPLDCPEAEIETLFAVLTSDAPTDDLVDFSNRLWPLARANFSAHVASHRPATGLLLYALIESHAAIDAYAIFEQLKAIRSAADLPAPAFSSATQGLTELLEIHAAAALIGYEAAQDAAGPMLECTLAALVRDEHHLTDALARLLRSYDLTIAAARSYAIDEIETAGQSILQQPDDPTIVERLGEAGQSWTTLCRPLLTWNAAQPRSQIGLDTPIARLRGLIIDLCQNKYYEAASNVMETTREIFAAVPTTIDELAEDARLAAGLLRLTNLKRLQDFIDDAQSAPAPLIAALEASGFSQTSAEPALSLWMAFDKAIAPTSSGGEDLPWKLVRDLTLRLSNLPEAARAVAALITGLIQYGEAASTKPTTLNELRNNLRYMQSFIGNDGGMARPGTPQPVQARSSFLPDLLKRLRAKAANGIRYLEPHRRKYVVGAALLMSLPVLGFAVYQNPDHLRSLLAELSSLSGSRQDPSSLGAQTIPPVGTGQHLEKDGVRYCYFQKERLRFIKDMTKGPEDARSYNLLIVDYNSRCSDFFYKDEDLKEVLAEVTADRSLLQTQASQIVSAWPGHEANISKN